MQMQLAQIQNRGQCANITNQGKVSPLQQNINAAYTDYKKYQTMITNYLRMISDAIRHLSKNRGTLRKHIWEFLTENYTTYADYRDFLVSIKRLLREGRLINEEGYFKVEQSIFKEIWEKPPTPNTRSNSVKENPFLSTKGRNSITNSTSNPFLFVSQNSTKTT